MQDSRAIHELLSARPLPSVILVADQGITTDRGLMDRVIENLRQGATVILCGCFSTRATMGGFTRLFARLGLPWHWGSYHRVDVSINREAVGNPLAGKLPVKFNHKAVFLQGAERSSVWYSSSGEAAVVFTQVGKGKLGYIGDVNGEKGTTQIILAMAGLL